MFQENRLIESLTIMENFKFAEDKSKNKLCSTGLVNKDYIIEKLNIDDKAIVNIQTTCLPVKNNWLPCKNLLFSSELIILDEPTYARFRTKTRI